MNLPTEKQCEDYFHQYKVPQNIFHHCLKVRAVSVFLSQQLKKSGIDVNLVFVERLALLHDIFKMASLEELKPNKYHHYIYVEEEVEMWKHLREKYHGKYEGEIAYEIFQNEYPELASSLKRVSDQSIEDLSWEELLVHYVDLRIFQEKVVSIAERMDYLQERYPREEPFWAKYLEKIKKQEAKIFSSLLFTPEQLKERFEEGHAR